MKACLLYKDRDFDLQGEFPSNEQALTQDLELTTLFNAMALSARSQQVEQTGPPSTRCTLT